MCFEKLYTEYFLLSFFPVLSSDQNYVQLIACAQTAEDAMCKIKM